MGIVDEPETAALGRYLDRWLETSAKPRPRMNTLEDYRKLLARYVRPVLGGRPLSRIPTLEIQGLSQGMLDSGSHGPLYARRPTFGLFAGGQVAHVGIQPSKRCRSAEAAPEGNASPGPDQTRQFLDEAAKDRLGSMFALAVTTGLRPGEYLALKWPDLHVMTGTLSVNRTLQWVKGGGRQYQDTKRTGSRRMVKLPSAICAMLEEHRICQEKERMDAGQNWKDRGLIFTTRTGGPSR